MNDFLLQMGKRIADRRKELHLTQEQVADRIDVSSQTISFVELGKKAIRPENLAKLCQTLDVSSDYILFGKRSEQQLGVLIETIVTLSPTDYAMISGIVERLSRSSMR